MVYTVPIECASRRSPCYTSWECGSEYEIMLAQAQPPPPCPAPPEQFMPPPEPGVCQISPESGMCEFLGERTFCKQHLSVIV